MGTRDENSDWRVYRLHEILKRNSSFGSFRASHSSARPAAIDRILQKFIASLQRQKRFPVLSSCLPFPLTLPSFQPVDGDPLSSRVNRSLSRREVDIRRRSFLSVRPSRVYRIFYFFSLFLFSLNLFFSFETPRYIARAYKVTTLKR